MEEDDEEEEDNIEKLEKNVENENEASEGSTYSEEENESEEDPMVDHALVLTCKMQPTLYVEVLKLCIHPLSEGDKQWAKLFVLGTIMIPS